MNIDSCRPGGLITNPAQISNGKPPLEQSIIMLDASLDFLNNGLNELYNRLELVLAQTPETVKQPTNAACIGNSGAVIRLGQICQRIEFMSDALAHIRSRLEV